MALIDLVRQPEGNSSASRVRRGFWRISVACSLITVLAGILIIIEDGNRNANYYRAKHDAVVCLRKLPQGRLQAEKLTPSWIDIKASGCQDSSYAVLTFEDFQPYKIEDAQSWYGKFLESWRAGIPLTMLFGALVFAVIYGAGWVVAGFFRDEK